MTELETALERYTEKHGVTLSPRIYTFEHVTGQKAITKKSPLLQHYKQQISEVLDPEDAALKRNKLSVPQSAMQFRDSEILANAYLAFPELLEQALKQATLRFADRQRAYYNDEEPHIFLVRNAHFGSKILGYEAEGDTWCSSREEADRLMQSPKVEFLYVHNTGAELMFAIHPKGKMSLNAMNHQYEDLEKEFQKTATADFGIYWKQYNFAEISATLDYALKS